jgi:hypothetical protein
LAASTSGKHTLEKQNPKKFLYPIVSEKFQTLLRKESGVCPPSVISAAPSLSGKSPVSRNKERSLHRRNKVQLEQQQLYICTANKTHIISIPAFRVVSSVQAYAVRRNMQVGTRRLSSDIENTIAEGLNANSINNNNNDDDDGDATAINQFSFYELKLYREVCFE